MLLLLRHGRASEFRIALYYMLHPPIKLPRDQHEPWIISIHKLSHIHVVTMNADRNIARENSGVWLDDLIYTLIMKGFTRGSVVSLTTPMPRRGNSS
jgi:hypothetical protein